MKQDFLIGVSWVLLIMALVWTMLKPTWVSALVLVAVLGLAVISIRHKKKYYVSRKRR